MFMFRCHDWLFCSLVFVDVSLIVVDAGFDFDVAIYLVCQLYVAGFVATVVLFLPDDVLNEPPVEKDVEEDVYAQLDVLVSSRNC